MMPSLLDCKTSVAHSGPKAPELLVSVRSVTEAATALDGGAQLIDVKEPDHGSLGRADQATIEAVLHFIDTRCPVSAALGEWVEGAPAIRDPRLAFVKWGLAGCTGTDWQEKMGAELTLGGNPRTVLVAYADWQCARAPDLVEVVALACRQPGSVLLIDTCCKEAGTLKKNCRPTLLDWLPAHEVGRFATNAALPEYE